MRLIDADKAKEKLRVNAQKDGNPFVGAIVEMFCEFLDQAPTVEDAEERGEIGRVPRWIPVTERMPKAEKPVLVMYTFSNTPKVTKAIYEDGTVLSDDSFLNWTEIWEYGNYDEETDSYFIPCGWWEYGDFAEFNNVIDHPVTHWMPLPEPLEVK